MSSFIGSFNVEDLLGKFSVKIDSYNKISDCLFATDSYSVYK